MSITWTSANQARTAFEGFRSGADLPRHAAAHRRRTARPGTRRGGESEFLPPDGRAHRQQGAISRKATARRNRPRRQPLRREPRLQPCCRGTWFLATSTGRSGSARDHSIFGRPLPGVPAQNGLVPVGVAAPHFELLFPPDANLEVVARFLGLRAHPIRCGQPQQRAVAA